MSIYNRANGLKALKFFKKNRFNPFFVFRLIKTLKQFIKYYLCHLTCCEKVTVNPLPIRTQRSLTHV